jgi:sigma-E factor negative regulatory protein RseA
MAWRRYHLIRDCIRQPGGSNAAVDLSGRIKDALASESTEVLQGWAGKRWLKPVSGLAIAASVALMAIIAVGPDNQAVNPGANVTADTGNEPFTSPNPLPAVPISQPASFNPEARAIGQAYNSRLNSYLVRHNQLAGAAGRQGFVSFVPIISSQVTDQDRDAGGETPENTENATEDVRVAAPQQP